MAQANNEEAGGAPRWKCEHLFCHDLPSEPRPDIGKVLVTGASGYIGGRLVPELSARGYDVRVMVRVASPEHACLWPDAEVVVADALELDTLRKALDGIHTVYYLIHSLLLGPDEFESADIHAAQNFRIASEEMGVSRIIYLGGLGDMSAPLSNHLRSRMEVAEELKGGSVPATILRAAIIIGSGSASYEIINHLARHAPPLMLLPSWANNRCQPIGVRDVIKYLVGVFEIPDTAGKSFDIGGKDILAYKDMLIKAVRLSGKKRLSLTIPFPFITLPAYITSFYTPVPAPIIRCLFESVRNEVLCQSDAIRAFLPFEPLGYEEAVRLAMSREGQDNVRTRWSDSYPPAHVLAPRLHEFEEPPRYVSAYSLVTDKDASALYDSFCKIGGKEGWFRNNWMWRLRGTLDRVLLGVGSARGRRSYSTLQTNDVIDFWRIEDLQPDQRLLLRAEMKLPGSAWLEFRVDADKEHRNLLSVVAYYDTRGFFGVLYWYTFLPFHHFIFTDLLEQIETRS